MTDTTDAARLAMLAELTAKLRASGKDTTRCPRCEAHEVRPLEYGCGGGWTMRGGEVMYGHTPKCDRNCVCNRAVTALVMTLLQDGAEAHRYTVALKDAQGREQVVVVAVTAHPIYAPKPKLTVVGWEGGNETAN